ncbi:hypothetical protein AAMO2058_000610600 [Amorphochlora amoebiformis]
MMRRGEAQVQSLLKVGEKAEPPNPPGSKPISTCKICNNQRHGVQATRFNTLLVKCPSITQDVLVVKCPSITQDVLVNLINSAISSDTKWPPMNVR